MHSGSGRRNSERILGCTLTKGCGHNRTENFGNLITAPCGLLLKVQFRGRLRALRVSVCTASAGSCREAQKEAQKGGAKGRRRALWLFSTLDNTRHERRRSKAHCSIFAKTMSTTLSALLQYGLS